MLYTNKTILRILRNALYFVIVILMLIVCWFKCFCDLPTWYKLKSLFLLLKHHPPTYSIISSPWTFLSEFNKVGRQTATIIFYSYILSSCWCVDIPSYLFVHFIPDMLFYNISIIYIALKYKALRFPLTQSTWHIYIVSHFLFFPTVKKSLCIFYGNLYPLRIYIPSITR